MSRIIFYPNQIKLNSVILCLIFDTKLQRTKIEWIKLNDQVLIYCHLNISFGFSSYKIVYIKIFLYKKNIAILVNSFNSNWYIYIYIQGLCKVTWKFIEYF